MTLQQRKVEILRKKPVIESQSVLAQIKLEILSMDVMDHQRFHHDVSFHFKEVPAHLPLPAGAHLGHEPACEDGGI